MCWSSGTPAGRAPSRPTPRPGSCPPAGAATSATRSPPATPPAIGTTGSCVCCCACVTLCAAAMCTVPGSRRYADPTAYLITTQAWAVQQAEFCALVGVDSYPAAALARVDAELHTALGELEQVLAGGQGPIRVDEHGELVIGPLTAEDLPAEAAQLKAELTR